MPPVLTPRASSLPPGPCQMPSAACDPSAVPTDMARRTLSSRRSSFSASGRHVAIPRGDQTCHIGPIPPLSARRDSMHVAATAPFSTPMGLMQPLSFTPGMPITGDVSPLFREPTDQSSGSIARALSAPSLGRGGRLSVPAPSPRSAPDGIQVPQVPLLPVVQTQAKGAFGGPSLSVPVLPPPMVPTLVMSAEAQPPPLTSPSTGSVSLAAAGFIAGGIPKAAPMQHSSAFHCGQPPAVPLQSVSRTSDGVPFEPPASEGLPRTGRLISASSLGQADSHLPRATTVTRLPDPLGWH